MSHRRPSVIASTERHLVKIHWKEGTALCCTRAPGPPGVFAHNEKDRNGHLSGGNLLHQHYLFAWPQPHSKTFLPLLTYTINIFYLRYTIGIDGALSLALGARRQARPGGVQLAGGTCVSAPEPPRANP